MLLEKWGFILTTRLESVLERSGSDSQYVVHTTLSLEDNTGLDLETIVRRVTPCWAGTVTLEYLDPLLSDGERSDM